MTLHICFSLGWISNQDVQDSIGPPIRNIFYLLMKQFSDILELRVRNPCECRHTLIWPALFQKGDQALPMIVAEHYIGGDQAWSSSSAAISAVTEGAVLGVQRNSPSSCDSIGYSPKPQKCPGSARALFGGHVAFVLLLYTFLSRRGRLLRCNPDRPTSAGQKGE